MELRGWAHRIDHSYLRQQRQCNSKHRRACRYSGTLRLNYLATRSMKTSRSHTRDHLPALPAIEKQINRFPSRFQFFPPKKFFFLDQTIGENETEPCKMQNHPSIVLCCVFLIVVSIRNWLGLSNTRKFIHRSRMFSNASLHSSANMYFYI